MAADHQLAENMSPNDDPVLRFYGWEPYCLSVGKHQKSSNIDFNRLQKGNSDAVRRPTGGSAIYHSRELTYSFVISKERAAHQEVYSFVNFILVKALIKLNYKVILSEKKTDPNYLNSDDASFACFNRSAKWEINYQNKKVVGSAQRIYKNAVLQHGSILIKNDQEKMIDLLKIDEEAKSRQINYIRKKSICLEDINARKLSEIELSEEIVRQFYYSGINIYYQYFSEEEKESMKDFYANFSIAL